MPNLFLISDTHFGHANILTFKNSDGTPLRPGFQNIKEHDQFLIDTWNNTVKPKDTVYHLGDVGMSNFTHIKNIFDALNGEKVLIKGNHDKFKASQYLQIFKDIRGYGILDRYLLSHIPIHPDSLSRWAANIHGHLHGNKINDPKYINVSVEQINYTPISLEELSETLSST
jgi:calcineurin-like phosphoesterase family protein